MRLIGVIGAGAAGVCAVRHILSMPGLIPIAWELSSEIGGTWVHTAKTGLDENGIPIHSSMYDNLRTNLPKEIMQFPDFAFPAGGRSFIHHGEVLKYLKDYSEHFEILDYIKFSHHVDLVEPIQEDIKEGNTRWKVMVTDLKSKNSLNYICDGLLICNGHYSVPQYPSITSIDNFRGLSLHSHDYREPSLYKDLDVIVLGAGASGLDISLEVSHVARKVYLSHNLTTPVTSKFPENLTQVAGIKGALEDGFVLRNDSTVKVDAIIYCTGYEYVFPFLSPSCDIMVKDGIVSPLYRHLINAKHPSMSVIGVPFKICPFPLFDRQVRYYLKVFNGSTALPQTSEMEEEISNEYVKLISEGKNKHHFHVFGPKQWIYNNLLSNDAQIDPLSPMVEEIYQITSNFRNSNLSTYKDVLNFKITGKDSYLREYLCLNSK